MKIKTIAISALILTCGFTAVPQTSKKALSAHNKIHSEQLANAKSRMDKNVITNMLREDITKKEEQTLSEESTKMISDLLSEAHRYIGRPYVHGAKGPKAFDCSGFTSYVYRQFGYTISPSSRTQYTEGTNVERNDLRKGDLVFFTSRRSGKNVGHVGIVVSADNESGNFKFIHASIKGVKVSDFEGYYLGRYVGARRIITE
ncbi:MAG: C40 family peptidase [Muribaculaceae bacterium]|nr:C40 family peptidase [Muribaculaceae bacterium]